MGMLEMMHMDEASRYSEFKPTELGDRTLGTYVIRAHGRGILLHMTRALFGPGNSHIIEMPEVSIINEGGRTMTVRIKGDKIDREVATITNADCEILSRSVVAAMDGELERDPECRVYTMLRIRLGYTWFKDYVDVLRAAMRTADNSIFRMDKEGFDTGNIVESRARMAAELRKLAGEPHDLPTQCKICHRPAVVKPDGHVCHKCDMLSSDLEEVADKLSEAVAIVRDMDAGSGMPEAGKNLGSGLAAVNKKREEVS